VQMDYYQIVLGLRNTWVLVHHDKYVVKH
jgi:hypothetical protein